MTDHHLTENPLDLEALLSETEDDSCGALLVFGGTVRNLNEGQSVDSMSYSAHHALAEKALREIEQQALQNFAISQCRCIHRLGKLQLGELSVLVVVRAAHRDAAFAAGRWAIDNLKARTAIWKQEHYTGGDSKWLDGTALNTEHHEQ